MREQEYKGKENPSEQTPIEGSNGQLPIVINVRTGLAGKSDALMDKVHSDDLNQFSAKTVKDAIDYLVEGADLTDKELSLAESVKKELGANGSVVVVNGKTAKLNDRLDKYLVTKEHILPDGSKRPYRELEIEVSAVQQGGFYSLLR